MDSSDLTKQQVEQLLAEIWPMLCYLRGLRDRMEQRSFPKTMSFIPRSSRCTMMSITWRSHCITRAVPVASGGQSVGIGFHADDRDRSAL